MVGDEILDHLPFDDPEAIRSRRDLRNLHSLLGIRRWFTANLRRTPPEGSVVELGAGRGELCQHLHTRLKIRICGVDLLPRPSGLAPEIRWVSGRIEDYPPDNDTACVIGSLILHHFEDSSLRHIADSFPTARRLLFVEPHRTRLALLLAAITSPMVGVVTRHDMSTSIRAGFRRGELARLTGLESGWTIRESIHPAGLIRFDARRINL